MEWILNGINENVIVEHVYCDLKDFSTFSLCIVIQETHIIGVEIQLDDSFEMINNL